MRIGGLTKQSFIDWDGKIAAVVFTKGCNFRCGYCHNPSLVLPELISKTPDIPTSEIIQYLESRKGWLDGVVITGGEPTIHSDLKDFLKLIKNIGFQIKLDTNGTNSPMLQELIDEKLIDYIAMDIKSILETKEYQDITNIINPQIIDNIKKSILIIKESGINHQFRTTIIPKHHSKEIIHQLKEVFKLDNYILQDFRNGITIENSI